MTEGKGRASEAPGDDVSDEPGLHLLFAAAIFLAATLLFWVQPMVGKMVLPRMGGSPEVWSGSIVFFQATLLVGYAYAHLTVRSLGLRRQVALHLLVLAAPLVLLPLSLPGWDSPAEGGHHLWLFVLLAAGVGAPFFVLATASPLLQRWVAGTRLRAAADPYVLYAVSNGGSLLGLLAYPFLLEPRLPLGTQALFWSAGYGAFALLVVGCGAVVLRRGQEPSHSGSDGGGGVASGGGDEPAPGVGRRLSWVVYAFVPSALFLAVTRYLSTDLVAVPLLWVLPLAIYLLTYIAAFSRRRLVPLAAVSRISATAALAVAVVHLGNLREPVWAMVLLHLAVLLVLALLAHGRLAASRPAPSRLTEYYLLIGIGGALGGVFDALVAPRLFDGIAEYPIAVALAAFLRLPGRGEGGGEGGAGDASLAGWARAAGFALGIVGVAWVADRVAEAADLPAGAVEVGVTAVLPAALCFLVLHRRLRFAVGVGALLAFAYLNPGARGNLLHAERTFFGVHRVALEREGRMTGLLHGTTVHGLQARDPERAGVPLGYYHPSGPGGGVIEAAAARREVERIAFVGLGTGALAALAGPHQELTIYEIDPAVVRIAEDPRFFDYLERSPADYRIVIGDGRIALSRSEERYDLIVLDAFSSSTVPVHLLTREAVEVYLDRLAPGGVVLLHLSNRYLDLPRVVAGIARSLGLAAAQNQDLRSGEERAEGNPEGVFDSHWAILAPSSGDLAPYVDGGWRPLRASPDAPLWTDDFSDIVSVFRWR